MALLNDPNLLREMQSRREDMQRLDADPSMWNQARATANDMRWRGRNAVVNNAGVFASNTAPPPGMGPMNIARGLSGGAGAAAIAGMGSALQGGSIGNIAGSAIAPLISTPLTNKFFDGLINSGSAKTKALGVAGKFLTNLVAAPLVGSAIGGSVEKGIGGIMGPANAAMSQGTETRAQSMLNPGSTSNRSDQSRDLIGKEREAILETLRRQGLNVNDVEVDRYKRIINPLLEKQAQLRMQMMPVDVAARMAVSAGQDVGRMYERSIAGTSAIAQQIAANNPYGQVMV